MLRKKVGGVAVLDVLGFKELMNHLGVEELYRRWSRIKRESKKWIKTRTECPPGVQSYTKTDIFFLSDTIILTTEIDCVDELWLLSEEVSFILQYGLLKENILFRGAISFGEFYNTKDTFLGPAVNDAGEWHEMGDWAGVFLTPKTSFMIHENNEKIVSPYQLYYYEYPVPMKNNQKIICKTIPWPIIYFWWNSQKVNEENVNHLLESVSIKMSSMNIDRNVVLKYQNTYEYLKKQLAHHISLFK